VAEGGWQYNTRAVEGARNEEEEIWALPYLNHEFDFELYYELF